MNTYKSIYNKLFAALNTYTSIYTKLFAALINSPTILLGISVVLQYVIR